MITVADTAIDNIQTTQLVAASKGGNKLAPVVICGSCGAQELVVDENKTECPHCDDYIY